MLSTIRALVLLLCVCVRLSVCVLQTFVGFFFPLPGVCGIEIGNGVGSSEEGDRVA